MGFTRNRFVHTQFPKVVHVRVDDAMHDYIRSRGGSHYVRQLVKKEQPPIVPDPAPATETAKKKHAKSNGRPKKHKHR